MESKTSFLNDPKTAVVHKLTELLANNQASLKAFR